MKANAYHYIEVSSGIHRDGSLSEPRLRIYRDPRQAGSENRFRSYPLNVKNLLRVVGMLSAMQSADFLNTPAPLPAARPDTNEKCPECGEYANWHIQGCPREFQKRRNVFPAAPVPVAVEDAPLMFANGAVDEMPRPGSGMGEEEVLDF